MLRIDSFDIDGFTMPCDELFQLFFLALMTLIEHVFKINLRKILRGLYPIYKTKKNK